nr:12631_t:CDS:2 [Entrophospora candida]
MRPGLTEEIKAAFRAKIGDNVINLTEEKIIQLWDNYYSPVNIVSSRFGGFQSATESGGGVCYSAKFPEGPSYPEKEVRDCDDGHFNPFAKRKEFADAESRLRKILLEVSEEILPEAEKEKLKKYQEADPSTFEYQKLIDELIGSRPENDANPLHPDSYADTDISDDKIFEIEAVENGQSPDQIALMVGSGNIISGIGGVDYNCVVINHRGKKENFSPGKNIEVKGIKMGPGKTYISFTADRSRTTLNILDNYEKVVLINDDDSNFLSVFEIVFNAITNDVNLKQILEKVGKEGNDFLDSITGRESDFVNSDGVTINYEKVKSFLGKIENLNDEVAIKSFRDEVLVLIKTKRTERQKTKGLDENLDRANSPDATDEQRVKTLKDSGELVGQETSEQKTKIEQIEKDLAKNPTKFREAIQGLLIRQMASQKVKPEELTSSKEEWESLETETDPIQIKNIKQKVSQEVGSKGAQKKIGFFTTRVKDALKLGDKKLIQQFKEKLIEFINSPNAFYQQRVSEAQVLLSQLENPNQQNGDGSPNSDGFP